MSEFRKYNPANMAPELFLRPPTQIVEGETRYIARQLAKDIYPPRGRLTIGTELEVLFFSPDADPLEAKGWPYRENPNYQSSHLRKMVEISQWAVHRRRPGEGPHSQESRLCVEFRTQPGDIDNYFTRVDTIRDAIQAKSNQCRVLPVVHSQHIHIAAVNNNGENPLIYTHFSVIKSVCSASISQVYPLTTLPEEMGNWNNPIPVRVNGLSNRRDPRRIEFRLLSSEWACDPSLNALLSLRAFGRCLQAAKDHQPDAEPAPLDRGYSSGIAAMRVNPHLNGLLGESTVAAICDLVQHYPRVSTREITIADMPVGRKPSAPENPILPPQSPSFVERIRAIGSMFSRNRVPERL